MPFRQCAQHPFSFKRRLQAGCIVDELGRFLKLTLADQKGCLSDLLPVLCLKTQALSRTKNQVEVPNPTINGLRPFTASLAGFSL